ncbi:hypothetical protein D3C87_1975520 [compost metagenome]
MGKNLLGFTADQQPLQAPAAVRRHEDHVTPVPRGRIDDALVGYRSRHIRFACDSRGPGRSNNRFQPGACMCGLLLFEGLAPGMAGIA